MGEWIEHDGAGCPLQRGTRVTVKLDCGKVFDGVVGSGVTLTIDGELCDSTNSFGIRGGSAWKWASLLPVHYHLRIIAYRLADTDDKATREARMAEFKRIADEALKTERPIKAPKKERADV